MTYIIISTFLFITLLLLISFLIRKINKLLSVIYDRSMRVYTFDKKVLTKKDLMSLSRHQEIVRYTSWNGSPNSSDYHPNGLYLVDKIDHGCSGTTIIFKGGKSINLNKVDELGYFFRGSESFQGDYSEYFGKAEYHKVNLEYDNKLHDIRKNNYDYIVSRRIFNLMN